MNEYYRKKMILNLKLWNEALDVDDHTSAVMYRDHYLNYKQLLENIK